MEGYRTIIFDLDGTLTDSLHDLAASVNHTLGAMSLPARSIDEIRGFVGDGIRVLLVRSLAAAQGTAGVADGQVEEALQIFRSHYALHCADTTRPYPGVDAMLRTLRQRGHRLAIVSNKPQAGVDALCRRFFAGTIDVALGENEAAGIRKKPAPDMVLKALSLLGEQGSRAVYVGDSEVDLATARNAGLPCISVLWGFRSRDFLLQSGATVFASSPKEVAELAGGRCS